MKKILFVVSAFVSICLLTACSDSSSNGETILKYEEAFQSAIDEYAKQGEAVSKSGSAIITVKKNEAKKAKFDKNLTDLEASLSKVNESGTKYFEDLETYVTGLTSGAAKKSYEKRLKTAKARFGKQKSEAEKTLRQLKKIGVGSGSNNVDAIVKYAKILNSSGKEFKGLIVKEGAVGNNDDEAAANENKKRGKKGKGKRGRGGKKKNKKPNVQEEIDADETETGVGEEVNTEEETVEVNDSTKNN
ncbi:MAG: hypothetical protein ACPG49_01445 [Chitinophagales bacterium]